MCVEKSGEGQVLVKCQGRIELFVELSNKEVDCDFVENSCGEIVPEHFTLFELK